jgi:uncharacterized coiled-coil protein SlyX
MADGVSREELKQELNALEDRLITRMSEQEERLITRMSEQEERLIEKMRDMQTEIIRVFLEFQSRNEDRFSLQEKTASVLTDRLASVERRLRQIEAKLLLEPPAA